MNYKAVLVIILLLIVSVGIVYGRRAGVPGNIPANSPQPIQPSEGAKTPEGIPRQALQGFSEPMSRVTERVTKKPFGLKVSPQNSPVFPEKFSGYHTGVDFEAFPDEQGGDVPVNAVCNGPLRLKRTAQGYGGVLVQRCSYQSQPVTVVYGHMRLSSVKQNVGAELKAGDALGVLGTGYGAETDNERKHLHLGIHKGSATELRGYVQNESELDQWMDVTKVW
jgi:hypothetical protein